MSKKNEVATTTKNEVATAGGFDYGDQAGAGFEGTTSEDLSIPFLSILQSNSPQVEDKDPAGAESGMLFNTVTRELVSASEGLVFMPVHKDHAFVEWVPRDSGGGFVGMHDPAGETVKKAIERNGGERIGRLSTGDNDLIETHYVYGLLLDVTGLDTLGFAVISFTSTKIKPFRDWFTSMYTLKGRPPIFANRARIKTIRQKNEHGTFHNFRIEPLGDTWVGSLLNPGVHAEAVLLAEGVAFRDMVTSGMAKADFGSQNAATGSGASDDGDGDSPF